MKMNFVKSHNMLYTSPRPRVPARKLFETRTRKLFKHGRELCRCARTLERCSAVPGACRNEIGTDAAETARTIVQQTLT